MGCKLTFKKFKTSKAKLTKLSRRINTASFFFINNFAVIQLGIHTVKFLKKIVYKN